MNPPYDGHPEQDGPPDWFEDLHSDDPRSPENDPPPGDCPGYDDDGPEPQAEDMGGEYDETEGKPPKIAWTVAADLEGLPVPQREWLVDEWLPVGTVTSLNGKGGTGKSLLAQQLASSVAAGLPFFGFPTLKCRVLGIFGEDDQGELHRRQAAICEQGIDWRSLQDFAWSARAGEQNSLVHESPERGKLDWSGFFMVIEETAKQMGARLVILDNIAQMFGANENDRALVTSFVNRLQRLAMDIEGAVLLLGHPGKGGAATEYSGSTAWDAAVRSRWLLRRPELSDDEKSEGVEADDSVRELVKAKANYSSIGDILTLEWSRGAFQRYGGGNPFGQTMGEKMAVSAREAEVSGLILRALDTLRTQKRHVSASRNAGIYAGKIMLAMKEFKTAKVRKSEFTAALERLFDEGRIRAGMAVWQKPSRHWAEGIGRVEWDQPDAKTAEMDPDTGEEEKPS